MISHRVGWIVWPEGEPERARFAPTPIAWLWMIAGPMGWGAMLRGRRMTNIWPQIRSDDPVTVASMIEASERMQV